jgi:hypothetical protein
MERISELGRALAISSTLMLDATRYSETSVLTITTGRHIKADDFFYLMSYLINERMNCSYDRLALDRVI